MSCLEQNYTQHQLIVGQLDAYLQSWQMLGGPYFLAVMSMISSKEFLNYWAHQQKKVGQVSPNYQISNHFLYIIPLQVLLKLFPNSIQKDVICFKSYLYVILLNGCLPKMQCCIHTSLICQQQLKMAENY